MNSLIYLSSRLNRILISTVQPCVDPHNISEHFIQFTHYTGHSKVRRSFLELIWLLCVWLIWNERNNKLFHNIQTTIDQLIEKVKFHTFW
jgi:hypothetical protein